MKRPTPDELWEEVGELILRNKREEEVEVEPKLAKKLVPGGPERRNHLRAWQSRRRFPTAGRHRQSSGTKATRTLRRYFQCGTLRMGQAQGKGGNSAVKEVKRRTTVLEAPACA